MRAIRICAVLMLVGLVAGCPSTGVRPPETKTALPAIGAPDLRGATLYAVDAKASIVHVQVFRGGTLARLGHNHVMTSQAVTGRVWTHGSPERSGFELEFPVAQLIVDDPQARAAAGGEFPGEIPAGDREGTRKNMLRPEVLDAERYPTITLRSVRIAGSAQHPQVTTRITIKEAARDYVVPADVFVDGQRLTASGAFDIQQTDFGIKPFSIGLGALEVQDRLHIEFKIVSDQVITKSPDTRSPDHQITK